MPNPKFQAFAPSNIALIKYMGKVPGSANLPENPSLSVTLDGLRTFAELERVEGAAGVVSLVPEAPASLAEAARPVSAPVLVPDLGPEGRARIEAHARRVLAR